MKPTREEMRSTLLTLGWRETIYGTFIAPGAPWYAEPWSIVKAYARVTSTKVDK